MNSKKVKLYSEFRCYIKSDLDLSLNRIHANIDNNNSKSILIVDDEHDIVNLIKHSLETDGFQVCAFTDGFAALEHFNSYSKKDHHQIVISDIRMPGINGYELVKQIKQIKPQINIVLMSAFEIEKNEFLNVLPGVYIDAFIKKPFSLKTIRNVIREKIKQTNK